MELAASPEDTKWQISPYNFPSKDSCKYRALDNHLDFEIQLTKNLRHDGDSVEVEEKNDIYRLTVLHRGTIVFRGWNVCLPAGEEPNLETLKKELL